MWNVLDHDKPAESRRAARRLEPSDRPQFSLAALMKFTAGLCVLLTLLTQMNVVLHPALVGLGAAAIPVGTFIVIRLVDVLA
jgi:hypothetical protein